MGDGVVVCLVGEGEGDDAEVDEVGLVDALQALGEDGFDAHVHRADGGVLAAAALSVGRPATMMLCKPWSLFFLARS